MIPLNSILSTIEPINFSTINYMHSYTEWLPESRARGLGGVLHKLSTELNVMRQEMRWKVILGPYVFRFLGANIAFRPQKHNVPFAI